MYILDLLGALNTGSNPLLAGRHLVSATLRGLFGYVLRPFLHLLRR